MSKTSGIANLSPSAGWTVDTFAAYHEASRLADKDLQEERDRRYAEVNIEREKALKIKETADLTALELARELQTYKDDKADKLRDQSMTERGAFVTRDDLELVVSEIKASLKPLFDFVAAYGGAEKESSDTRTTRRLDSTLLIGAGMAVLGIISLIVTVVAR